MTAKEDIKKALDGLAQFIIMNDNGTDESASAIEWHNILTEALERAKKEHELLGLYKELAIVRFYLFSETDADLGQELMNKDDDLNKQIKQLEEEMK